MCVMFCMNCKRGMTFPDKKKRGTCYFLELYIASLYGFLFITLEGFMPMITNQK